MGETSLKDIARETGLAVSTVSYALRGAANVPERTARKVREAAERLGYRAHPRVAELMARVRRGRGPAAGERLALVWIEAGAARGAGRMVSNGARSRAAERGYGLEEFTLKEAGDRPGRLADILIARGMAGVVFGPVFGRARVDIAWPWERFAMAVVGTAEWGVGLSRAAHHHYEAMREALARVEAAGARRPAAWIDGPTNERAHRGWQAAWSVYAPKGAAGRLWMTDGKESVAEAGRWLAEKRPDALVVSDPGKAEKLRAAGWRSEAGRLVVLDWREKGGFPGVDQGYATIAGYAVDLVVAQLQRNERGLPEPPRALLFPGRWVEGGDDR
jgi:LacI family transcriptional regulator